MKNRYLIMASILLLSSCGGQKDEPVDTDIPVASVALSPASLDLETGKQATVKATVTPKNATDPSIKWMSSAEGVASVKDGIVTAVSAGEATITALAGECSATCRVKVTDPIPPYVEVTSVALDRKSRLLPVGSSFSLTATVLPFDATDPSVVWSSSDDGVATVSEGTVTAVSEGTVRIMANASGSQAACLVTVVPEGPSGQEIWYVSWTGAALKFDDISEMGVKIVSNTYTDGKGVIIFDKDVTGIPSGLFQGRSGLRNVWLPDTVTEIGFEAFKGCSTLLNVYLQEGIRQIGSSAFQDCQSLRKLALPGTLETLGQNVIRNDGMLTELIVPENVVSLGDYSLYGCPSLASLTFLADQPASLGFRALDETGSGAIYVPAASLDSYKAAKRWSDYSERIQTLDF